MTFGIQLLESAKSETLDKLLLVKSKKYSLSSWRNVNQILGEELLPASHVTK